jgi:hypothetical protein
VQPAPRRSGVLPAVLIGCGFALVVVLVVVIGFTVLIFNSADFQRSFCNGWTNSNANQACPFHPSPH